MGDDELSELRKRRMAQLQQQAGDQQAMQDELERQQRAKNQMQMVLMSILEPDARERLNTIKSDETGVCRCRRAAACPARPERASQEQDHGFAAQRTAQAACAGET